MAIDPLTAGLDLAKTAINAFFPDKTEAEKAQLAAAVTLVQGQMNINAAEASNPSVFVSGWRPSVGWVCSAGFAVQFVIGPLAEWIAGLLGHPFAFPKMDLTEMLPILLGMLGLGSLRTVEKVKGVAAI